jgi:hypothetical protein
MALPRTTITRRGSLQPAKLASSARHAIERAPGGRPFTSLAGFAACETARRWYRWTRTNLNLPARVAALQRQLTLPIEAGPWLRDIDPALDERVAPLRTKDCELVIGDFDQDGAILPRFGPMQGMPTISAAKFLPRSGCPVRLVDLNGRVGVRKEFGRALGRLVQETEALVVLGNRGCPVPRLMNVDWAAGFVTVSFIAGDVVREMLALAGAPMRDRDHGTCGRAENGRRTAEGRRAVPEVVSARTVAQISSALTAIHSAGFALEDVKYGNIILERHTREPFFIDLERALPLDAAPAALADHLRNIDWRKFEEHFGAPGPKWGR